MACKNCGRQYVSGLCKACARQKSRDGDWQDRLSQHQPDGGTPLTAELETMAGQHANDALAAMDAQEYGDAEYHARQFLQAIVGLNTGGGGQ